MLLLYTLYSVACTLHNAIVLNNYCSGVATMLWASNLAIAMLQSALLGYERKTLNLKYISNRDLLDFGRTRACCLWVLDHK